MIGFYDYTVILTYMALAASVGGIFCSADGHPLRAIVLLLLAGFLDLFDGKVARTKKDRTAGEKMFGIEIDSLDDVISFGVLPSVIAYNIGEKSVFKTAVLILFVLCGLIRLAYYNVSEYERQHSESGVRREYFGMPITSSAISIPFTYLVCQITASIADINVFKAEQITSVALCSVMLLSAVLFISPIKVKKPHGKTVIAIVTVGVLLILLSVLLIVKAGTAV